MVKMKCGTEGQRERGEKGVFINVVVNCRIKYNYIAQHYCHFTDMGKMMYLEKNLSQCHLVCHESHTDWPGIRAWTYRTYRP
jgi:hypothetical protein